MASQDKATEDITLPRVRWIQSLKSKSPSSQEERLTLESELAQECGTLRYQNTHLRKDLTAALKDSRSYEQALQQAQAFERIGREAAGVAHDFNNFIMGILGTVQEVWEDLGPQSPHRDDLEMVIHTAQKAGALSKRLLSLGHRQNASRQILNLNHVIDEMGPFLPRVLGGGIKLDVLSNPLLGNIKADRSQMEQVILNLILNARDAMPEGGMLTLETSNVDSETIQLAVSDTGTGIDPETREHIFEPFFTTKETMGGTGIGLATLKAIIEEHGGQVSVTSEPHCGSRFTVLLPRVP
jgi:two-component system, cell cycle sensor histidine kinase and response regulator CckA